VLGRLAASTALRAVFYLLLFSDRISVLRPEIAYTSGCSYPCRNHHLSLAADSVVQSPVISCCKRVHIFGICDHFTRHPSETNALISSSCCQLRLRSILFTVSSAPAATSHLRTCVTQPTFTTTDGSKELLTLHNHRHHGNIQCMNRKF
jgi:hypothetical protein